jgi:hypothetical protein
MLDGCVVTAGAIWAGAPPGGDPAELTISVAGWVLVEPWELAKTARYSLPLSALVGVKV